MQTTRRQRVIERQYGKPLGDVIDDLLYDRDLTLEQAARRLGISRSTLWFWRQRIDGQNGHAAASSPLGERAAS